MGKDKEWVEIGIGYDLNNSIEDTEEVKSDLSETSNTFEVAKKSRKELFAEKKDKKSYLKNKIDWEYYDTLRENSSNKKSVWLNIIAFIFPILGIFWCFYYLLKCPNRTKSMLKVVGISMIFQVSFIIFCYLFLFEFLGNLFLTMFG